MTLRLASCSINALLAYLPLAAQPPSACINCGQERWDIKTLNDTAAKQVNFTPKPSTVKALYQLKAPKSGAVRNPSEMQVYTLQAKLVGYKIEFNPNPKPGEKPGDHDFHIVIQEPGGPETMVVEIPD